MDKKTMGMLSNLNPVLARQLDEQERQKRLQARIAPTNYGNDAMGRFLTAWSGAARSAGAGGEQLGRNIAGESAPKGQYTRMYEQQQQQYAKQFGEVAKFVTSNQNLTEQQKKDYIVAMSPKNKMMSPEEVYLEVMKMAQEEAKEDTFIAINPDGSPSSAPFTGTMVNGRVADAQGNIVPNAVRTKDLNEATVDLTKQFGQNLLTDEILTGGANAVQKTNQVNEAIEQAGTDPKQPNKSNAQLRQEGLGKFNLFGIKAENFSNYETESLKRVAPMLVTPEEYKKMNDEEKRAYVNKINSELTVREDSFTDEQRQQRASLNERANQYLEFKASSQVFWNNIDNAFTGTGATAKLLGAKAVDLITFGAVGLEDEIASTELIGTEQGKILLNMAEQMKGALSDADMQFLKDVAMTIGNTAEALKVGFAILEAKKMTDASVATYLNNTLNGDLHRLDEFEIRRLAGERNLERVLKLRGVDSKYIGMFKDDVIGAK